MKFRLALLALFGVLFVVPALAQYPQAWSSFKNFGQPTYEGLGQVIPAPGGGYFLGGGNFGSTIVARVDDTGSVLWMRLCQGVNGGIAANGNGVAVIGYVNQSFGAETNSLAIQRYDLQGALLWTKTIASPGDAQAGKVAVDPAGNVIVMSDVFSGANLQKFDAATGAAVFNFTIQHVNGWQELKCDPNGAIYFSCAYSVTGDPKQNVAVFKYSATGAQMWSKTTHGIDPVFELDSSGLPYSFMILAAGTRVVKYDADGNVMFDTSLAHPQGVGRVAISQVGSVAMCGYDGSQLGSVTKLDSAGATQWNKSVGAAAGPVAFDSSDNLYALPSTSTPTLTKFDTSGNVSWSTTMGLNTDYANAAPSCVLIDALGRVVVGTSHFNANTTFTDLSLRLFASASGATVWSLDYDAHKTFDEIHNSVTDSAGNSYLFGTAEKSIPVLCKFASNGNPVWFQSQSGLAGSASSEAGPVLVPTGGVVVAMTTSTFQQFDNLGVYRYDTNGSLLWSYIETDSMQRVLDIKAGPDGSIYLCMTKNQQFVTDPPASLRLKKLDPTGHLVWTTDRSPDAITDQDTPSRIALGSTGGIYVAMTTQHTVDNQFLNEPVLYKYNNSGVYQWSRSLGMAYPDSGDSVLLDSNGNVNFVAQVDDADNNSFGEWIYKYDPDGNLIWNLMLDDYYGGPPVAIDSLNNIFVLGYLNGANSPRVQKVTGAGVSAWTRPVPEAQNILSPRMLPDNGGGIIFTCVSSNGTAENLNAYRLLPDGTRSWTATDGSFSNGALVHAAGRNDQYPGGGGLDTAGNLYLTGSLYSPYGSHDFNVTKYNATDSLYVNQFVGSHMTGGQTYQVAFQFKNTGIATWTNATGYRLYNLNTSTWGSGGANLSASELVAPGQVKTFYFNVTAPSTPGTYPLQCKMYRNGFGSFGAVSAVSSIIVSAAPNSAKFVSISAPASVIHGATFSVTVDMQNIGSNTWAKASGYVLSAVPGYSSWYAGVVQLAASDSIVTNQHKVFTFTCRAPASPGTYKMSWQMKVGTTFFGDQSISKSITVTP